MASTQNRYTYPMADSRAITLQMHLRQKFYRYDYNYQGVQFKDSTQNRVDIYRFTGRVSHRFNINHYNHLSRYWDPSDISLNQRMELEGWELLTTIAGSNISLTNNYTSAEVDISTQTSGMNIPGYYRDIWQMQIEPENEIVGPVIQSFRLESRTFGVYGSSFRPHMNFDIQVYPTIWPTGSSSFPIAVSVLPRISSTGDPFICESLKTMLSNARLELNGVWQVANKDGEAIDPPLKITGLVYPITFEDQYFNWFFKNVDLSYIEKEGTFRLSFRLKWTGGFDSGYGQQDSGTFQTHWKEIFKGTVDANFGTPPSEFFQCVNIPAMTELCCSPGSSGLAAYEDSNQQLVPIGGSTKVTSMFDPRTEEPLVPYFEPIPASQQSLDDIIQIDFTNVAGSIYATSQVPSSGFPFMVIADGMLMRPDNPIDGTGSLYDYSLEGQTLTFHTIGWFNFLQVVYGYSGVGTKMGLVAQEVFLPGDGALIGGGPTWGVTLSNIPNGIFHVVAMDGVTLPQGASGEYIFNGSTIECTSQPTDKLIVTYSYGATDVGPNSVTREIFAGGSNVLNLANTPDNWIPPMIWDNGVHLFPDQGATLYDYAISGSQVVFNTVPAGPAVHVVYSY